MQNYSSLPGSFLYFFPQLIMYIYIFFFPFRPCMNMKDGFPRFPLFVCGRAISTMGKLKRTPRVASAELRWYNQLCQRLTRFSFLSLVFNCTRCIFGRLFTFFFLRSLASVALCVDWVVNVNELLSTAPWKKKKKIHKRTARQKKNCPIWLQRFVLWKDLLAKWLPSSLPAASRGIVKLETKNERVGTDQKRGMSLCVFVLVIILIHLLVLLIVDRL